MASGVNVKMGVSGVSQFKQNINSAKTSLKTLDAQLQLTEKQYQATGDKEKYMQEKSELLKVKLEEQKAIVAQTEKALEEMTRNGVDKGSKAFQTMQQEMLKAKGALLDTEAQLNGVADSTDTVSDNVSEMNANMKRIGEGVSWQNVTEGLQSITSGMEAVITKAWQVGQAIVNNTLGAGQWADELKTTADQWGITPEQLQRMRKTEQLIDTSTDTILSSQDKLKKGLAKGDKETMGAFIGLGINPAGKNWEDVFWETGEAIANLGDEEEQVAYAQKIFGKSWRELMPLFKAGREEYEKTNASWHVVGDEQLETLGKMDDQYQRMQGEWETFKTTLWSTFSGPLTRGMEILTQLLEKLNEYLASEEGQAMMQKLSDTMTGLVEDLMDIDPEQVIGGLQAVFDKLMEGLEWLADPANMDKVTSAIKLFIGAWAGLKAASGVSTALQLFSGLKGIGIGGGGGTAVATGGGGTAVTAGIGTKLAATGSAIKGFLAAGGGASMLVPAGLLAVVLGASEVANRWDLGNLEAQRAARLEKAGQLGGVNGDWMAKAANALGVLRDESGNPIGNIFGGANLMSDYGAQGDLLMGMKSRGTIEKAKLLASLAGRSTSYGNDAQMELLRYWESGGEGWEQARITALMDTVTDSYETMATRVDALAVSSDKEAAAAEKFTTTAELLDTLPDRLDSAVQNSLGRITVILDGQKVGAAVMEPVSWGMAGIVQKMTK